MDYFEYEKIKNDNKIMLQTLYTEDEIKMFDGLIEPLSPAGEDMRKEYDFKTNYWSAIPGGIPSFLINGVCIKNNKLSDEIIEQISKLFPNATIFRGNLDVVCYPRYGLSKNNKKK